MGYGRRFLASLPPAPIVHDLDASRRSSRLKSRSDFSRAIECKLCSTRCSCIGYFCQEDFHGPPIERPAARGWSLVLLAVLALRARVAALRSPPAWSKGVVKDAEGKPVEGAKVIIELPTASAASSRPRPTRRASSSRSVSPAGSYKVTAEKDKLGVDAADGQRVACGRPAEVNARRSAPAAAAALDQEARGQERRAEEDLRGRRRREPAPATTTRRSRSSQAAADDQRRTASTATTTSASPTSQKKDYDKAEAAYKKAIEMKADYAEAYSGLATSTTRSSKFDEAAAVSAKAMELSGGAPAAAGGGNADAIFNQGVILWNAGKIAEAKKQFEDAIAANPNHAESHYQLGMALVNEGNLAGRRHRVRDLPQARADRAERRRPRRGCSAYAEEVVIDAAALRARLADVRARIARRGRPGRARSRRRPPRRRLQDLPRRRRPRRRRRRAARLRRKQGPGSAAEDGRRPPTSPLRWHLIGHLQSNKAQKAGDASTSIHSSTAPALLQKLDEARRRGRPHARSAGPGRSGGRSDQARRPRGRAGRDLRRRARGARRPRRRA